MFNTDAMDGSAFIGFRVSAEMKARVRMLAERENISESALVKQLLDVMLRSSLPGESASIADEGRLTRGARLSIRLGPQDRMLLTDRAAARGIPAATYVSFLVRSHLRGVAPIPNEELLALKRAISELGAVGRNLNQIARAMNSGSPSAPASGSDAFRAMLKVAEGLRDHFKALLVANARSWEQGHAE